MDQHAEPTSAAEAAARWRDESKMHQKERDAAERKLARATRRAPLAATRARIEAHAREEARREVLPTVVAALLSARGIADATACLRFLDISTVVDENGDPDPARIDAFAASVGPRPR